MTVYKDCNFHGLNSVKKSILLFGGKIPGDNAFPCHCEKFGKVADKFTDRNDLPGAGLSHAGL